MKPLLEKAMWKKYKELADYLTSEKAQQAMEIALYGDKEEIEKKKTKLDKDDPIQCYFLEEFLKLRNKYSKKAKYLKNSL